MPWSRCCTVPSGCCNGAASHRWFTTTDLAALLDRLDRLQTSPTTDRRQPRDPEPPDPDELTALATKEAGLKLAHHHSCVTLTRGPGS
jgi:hypothetical protein